MWEAAYMSLRKAQSILKLYINLYRISILQTNFTWLRNQLPNMWSPTASAQLSGNSLPFFLIQRSNAVFTRSARYSLRTEPDE